MRALLLEEAAMERFELPEGWEWQTFRTKSLPSLLGTTAHKVNVYFSGGQFPFVRAQDVGRYGRTINLTETTDRVTQIAAQKSGLNLRARGRFCSPKSGASILTNSRAKLGVDAYIVSHLAIVEGKTIGC